MKIGAVFPQTEMESDRIAVRDYIQAVEDMGFEYLLAYDHVLGANPDRPEGWRGPYTYQHPFHEIFVLFAYGAALTEKLEFVSGILILPQRQTALVAKQAATIDSLSGGRLRLGVAIGWNHVEYEALGEDFSKRGRRIEEQVTLLRRLWTEDLITFDGDFDHIPDAGIRPLPVQQPIPIWFGGGADVVLKRMARMGDGWMPNTMPIDRARPMVEQLRGYLSDNDRNPDDFGIDIRVNLSQMPTPDDWSPYVAAWRDLGATHVACNTMAKGFTSVDQHIAALRKFIEAM